MKKITLLISGGLLSALLLSGCASSLSITEKGALIGAGGGALVGQLVGGNTGSTLAGAAIAGVAGGFIGHIVKIVNTVFGW